MAQRDTPGAQTGIGEGAAATLARRLHAFRSLGDNCEFGFVQRYGGVEPSGLLRFSYTPLAATAGWRESQGAVWLGAILRQLVPLVSPDGLEPPAGRTV